MATNSIHGMHMKSDIKYNNEITHITLPKNYKYLVSVTKSPYYWRSDPNIQVKVLYSKRGKRYRRIGKIDLCSYEQGIFETHSHLSKEHRGKGIGTLLYAGAIQWCHQNKFR